MELSLYLAPAITYAGVQNSIPVIQEIRVESTEEVPVSNLTIRVSMTPSLLLRDLVLHVARLDPGVPVVFRDPDMLLRHDHLASLQEAQRGVVLAEVLSGEEVLATTSAEIEVLAYDEWAGLRQLPELLAAFAQPNSKAVASILRRASELLHAQHGESLSGYQAADRQAVARQIAALYAAIAEQKIHYSNPPASFTGQGQKIRLPDRLLEEKLGTCLDLAMLLVSCLEQAGLHPLMFLEDGHAWVGCWLYDSQFATPTVDSRQQVRKRLAAGELLAIEATCLTPQSHAGFSAALKLGAEKLEDTRVQRFDLAIDVHRTRHGQKILPLPVRSAVTIDGMDFDVTLDPVVIEDVELPPLGLDVVVPDATTDERPGAGRIEQWRAKLLDLTLRNRLINFKPTKQTIPLCCPDAAKVEDALADGDSFKLGSLKDQVGDQEPRSKEQALRRSAADFSEHAARDALARHELLADLTADELDQRLTEIFRSARMAQEEGGANVLFLVLGMLQWQESKDSDRSLMAPLLMVPVTLERRSVKSGFTLKRHDDETIVNPTLLQLLENKFDLYIDGLRPGAELPSDDSGVDVADIWARFARAVVDLPGFEVKREVCLGLFSFTKYLMWKDLTDRIDDVLQSPLVRQLVGKHEEGRGEDAGFPRERELDDIKQPNELYTPIDCDSSQLAAVSAAADTLSFVLKGPPGTGKSQTITNIIADALARGRTVLFVSEKIAALNVVHERLKKLGLGPFLLELHSAKATKSGVLAQLESSLNAASHHTAKGWEAESARIGRLRRELNDYVRTLHEEHPNGLTVFGALALTVSRPAWQGCRFEWPQADAHDQGQLEELQGLARRLGTIGALLDGVDKSLFRGLERREWTPGWQSELLEKARALRDHLTVVEQDLDLSLSALGVSLKTRSLDELLKARALYQVLLQFRPEFSPLLAESGYANTLTLLHTLAAHGQRRQQLATALLADFSEGLLRLDATALLQRWQQSGGYWFFKRWLARFRIRNVLRLHHRGGARPNESQVPGLLEQLGHLQEEDQHLQDNAANAARLLGGLWLQERSDWEAVSGAAQWLAEYDRATQALAGHDLEALLSLRTELSRRLANLALAFAPDGDIGRVLRACQACLDSLLAQLADLEKLAGSPAGALTGDVTRPHVVGDLRQLLQGWESVSTSLRDWCQWQEIAQDARQRGMQPFLKALEEARLPAVNTVDYFNFCYAQWWLDRMVDATPLLQKFSAADHEEKISEFRAADELYARLTREHVKATLASRVPGTHMAAAGTPLGILKREMQKKTRHMPVRKLLATLSGVLPRLSPCLLMSPLSVAQYLDASARFDLVVFDEASQIPTWDAVGAIARGKQVIVVGDPKQLPPTTFFAAGATDSMVAEDEVEDLESILDECIGSGLPTHTLKWHYRSRRESLIAFSNYRYYGSELITFPSPAAPDKGVAFHAVDGVYQRAGARTNRAEAEAIVAFIRRHFADPGQRRRSLGVVTFSQPQQKLVEDLLDAARRADSKLDSQISAETQEPVFIKNLENVQGDERDIILFSICYGPDETGRVFMNFGPLNREGGHRRLNVAVTRAKEEIHLFATLRPEQMDISKTKAAGVSDLKLYLEYAMKGPQALIAHSAPTGLPPDSPFEVQVRDFLLDDGWEVHPQVGCSNYRIDLAIVNKDAPGSYLLGVECDGATYHSAATARDRDKLRQMVLERLGWRIHRIWSTEWWTNQEREKGRLKAAIEAARQAPAQVGVVDGLPEAGAEQDDHAQSVGQPSDHPEYGGATASPTQRPVHQRRVAAPYPVAKLARGDRDKFLLSSEDHQIRAAIQQVVTAEGPVSENVIRRRVCEAYGFERAGNRIQERLQVLQRGVGKSAVENGRTFLWPAEVDLAAWQSFREAGGRDVGDIHVQELANIARAVLDEMVVADEPVVIKAMGTLLGIQRVTAQAQARLQQGVSHLRATGVLEEVIGGLRVKD
ncbi:MAG: DUF3320 domain-containing protein [Pseudomonadota bacterium]